MHVRREEECRGKEHGNESSCWRDVTFMENVDWRPSVVSQTASFVFSVSNATLVTISKQGTCLDYAEVTDRK